LRLFCIRSQVNRCLVALSSITNKERKKDEDYGEKFFFLVCLNIFAFNCNYLLSLKKFILYTINLLIWTWTSMKKKMGKYLSSFNVTSIFLYFYNCEKRWVGLIKITGISCNHLIIFAKLRCKKISTSFGHKILFFCDNRYFQSHFNGCYLKSSPEIKLFLFL